MKILPSLETEAVKHLELIGFDKVNAPERFDGNQAVLAEEIATTPIFSWLAHTAIHRQQGDLANEVEEQHIYSQYGLLGYCIDGLSMEPKHEGLVYANVSAPWSAFICGSQGSGKSHTLSCLLENCVLPSSPAGSLSSPLAGLVLHYDKFTAYSSTQLCEAAYLCSANIPVRVLVSPTNYVAMKNAYSNLAGLGDVSHLLKVERMYLPKEGLNIAMMRTLMGIADKKHQPLYMDVSPVHHFATREAR